MSSPLDTKPSSIDEYKKWLGRLHEVHDVDTILAKDFALISGAIHDAFQTSEFWTELGNQLREFDAEYQSNTGYDLLLYNSLPTLHKKSFDSFFLKTFRKNVLENNMWKRELKPPYDGWILPENWFERTNDIVRTFFLVKYLDGIEFLAEKIQALGKRVNTPVDVAFEARDQGYYAAHLYVRQTLEVPANTQSGSRKITVTIEIQIVTQLQDVIRKLTHKYYEDRRAKPSIKGDKKWQWRYKDDEFVANYLGHILHYVEGMIMDLRERQRTR